MDPMKKLIALFLCLCLMAGIVPVVAENTAVTHEITSASYPLYVGTTNFGDVTLCFLDGANDRPYIEATEMHGVLASIMNSTTGNFNYTINTEGSVVTLTRNNLKTPGAVDDGAYAAFDFDKDTITFSDHDLFCWKDNVTTVLDTTAIATFNANGEPSILQKVDKGNLDRYGDALVVRCGDYGIDLILQDGKYLVPLQTMVDFILAPARGQNLFFNGQILYLALTISLGDEQYYAAPTGERSAALAEYGYKELCMMLDYFYGLKDAHKIESFDKLFHSVTFDRMLMDTNAKVADMAINYLINDYLDDGHSRWRAPSYLTGSVEFDIPNGGSVSNIFAEMDRYKEARKKYYPDKVPGYEEIGNTAYITFDSFNVPNLSDMESYYLTEDINSFDDSDVVGLIIKAHAQITRENSPIENVVLDLSCNGGGMNDVAAYVLGWLLGEVSLSVENPMTGAMSTAAYRADVNRDRKFDETDTVSDKRIFCLTSPCSFSNANMVACMLKDSNKVTMMGRTSAGGSCEVQNASSAWGSSFTISSPKRSSFLKNGSFYDIDRGADPDYQISTPEKYYDRQKLTEYINSLY